MSQHTKYVLFPIQDMGAWDRYKRHVAHFWTVEEVPLDRDLMHWKDVLTSDERYFIQTVLAFFAASDGIVNENLALRFYRDVSDPEVRCFYGFQICMENIHSEMYSLLIDTFCQSTEEKNHLFHAIDTIPVVKQKAQWALHHIESELSFAHRLIAFAAVEGIFFSGSFCAIFWLKKRGLMPGLCLSNEFISRDEGLHCDFASYLFTSRYQKTLSEQTVHTIIQEAVQIEHAFVETAIPVRLIGINAESMKQYICHVADTLLQKLNCSPLYRVGNPFDWMTVISVPGKSNFFERKNSEYSKAIAHESGNLDDF